MSIRTNIPAFIGIIFIGMCPIAGLATEFDSSGKQVKWEASRYRYIFEAGARLMGGSWVEIPGVLVKKRFEKARDGSPISVTTVIDVSPATENDILTFGDLAGREKHRQTTRWGITVDQFDWFQHGSRSRVSWTWREHDLKFTIDMYGSVTDEVYGAELPQGSEQTIAAIADAMHEAAALEVGGSLKSSDESDEWVSTVAKGVVGAAVLAALARIITARWRKLRRKSRFKEVEEGRPPMMLTDAAGKNHEYEYDPQTGDYVNILTGGVYDATLWQESNRNMPGNEEFKRIQREKVRNKDTSMDRALEEIKERHEGELKEKIDAIHKQKKDLINVLRRIEIQKNTREDLIEAAQALSRANKYDWLLSGAETVEAAADIGIDFLEGLSTAGGTITNPWTKAIKYGYYGAKGAASGWSETLHEGGPNTTWGDYMKNMGTKSLGNLVTTAAGDVIQGAPMRGYNVFANRVGRFVTFNDVWVLKDAGLAAVNAVKGRKLGDWIINPIKDYFLPKK